MVFCLCCVFLVCVYELPFVFLCLFCLLCGADCFDCVFDVPPPRLRCVVVVFVLFKKICLR